MSATRIHTVWIDIRRVSFFRTIPCTPSQDTIKKMNFAKTQFLLFRHLYNEVLLPIQQ